MFQRQDTGYLESYYLSDEDSDLPYPDAREKVRLKEAR
jgi:hypothetical protein